jgi:hypothetical protein
MLVRDSPVEMEGVIALIFASVRRLAVCAAAVLIVAGCTVPEDRRHGYRPLPAEDGLIAFDAPAFAGRQPTRVLYADRRQREEYARFQGGGAQAEVVYLSIRTWHNPRSVLDGVAGLDGMLETWSYLDGRLRQAQEAVAWQTDLAKIWFRTFRLSGSSRACMGFRGEWNFHAWDRLYRPTHAVFGYYCAMPGADITTAEAGTLMDGLGILGINRRLSGQSVDIAAIPDEPTQRDLAALVQSRGGGSLGASQFPFRLATTFSPDGGGVIVVP